MILGNFKDLIKSPSGNRAMLITAVCFAMGLGIIWSPLADQINVKLIKTLEFRFRALAGMNPTLDPRIKVFAFDDRTAAKAQYPDLSIRDWSMLAAEVAKFKPKGIFFDKVFGLPMNQRQIPAAVETVNSAINRVDTRLVHGIFVSNTKIRSHNTHIQEAHGDFNQSFPIKLQNTSHIKWIQPTYQHVYGAHPKLRPFLRNPGHNNYDGNGRFFPVYRIQPDWFVPHWAFQAVQHEILINEDGIKADGYDIPMDSQNRSWVNFLDRDDYTSYARSLIWFTGEIEQGRGAQIVKPGDYVVILPHMFTGNTDFKETQWASCQVALFRFLS